MIRNLHLQKNLGRCLLSIVALVWACAPASAYTISLTGGMSGGNPGDQPLYEVSGLVQGDAFNVAWGGVSGLSVTGMVIIDSLSATNADIRVMLDNLSTPISGNDPRVTSVGLEIDGFTVARQCRDRRLILDALPTTPISPALRSTPAQRRATTARAAATAAFRPAAAMM